MNKTKLVTYICIGAAFACVPLWIFKVVSIGPIIGVFATSLITLGLLVTGVLGKIFNKK